jgi:hypothetical protein
MNAQGITAFVAALTEQKLLALRDELEGKLLSNTRHVALAMGGKSITQTELVDTGLLMGIVASELRRRRIVTTPAPATRTVARFV